MGNRPNILVVDDDPAWLERIVSTLNKDNYEIDQASSFEAATKKIRDKTYALLIIDLELNVGKEQAYEGFGLLDGIQFLIKKTQSKQGKAIVVSAHRDVERIRQSLKRGAYDFFRKQDFDTANFLVTVREAIREWRVTPNRELTIEEKREYERVTRKFLRGEKIQFDAPEDAINPWATLINDP